MLFFPESHETNKYTTWKKTELMFITSGGTCTRRWALKG